MPKQKTHRGAAKRFGVTGSGKFKHKKGYHSHLLSHKSAKRRRTLRQGAIVNAADEGHLRRLLPYS